MNDSHVTLFHLAQSHWMNVMYAMIAMCITYKMATIARQIPIGESASGNGLRIVGAVVATIVTYKAFERFENGDAATWLDIFRELSWCGFLALSIVVLKEKFGRW